MKTSSVRFTDKTKGYNTYTVIGGEFAVGSDEDNVAFKTLLGSCVVIMLMNKMKKIKAMNHFLLPILNEIEMTWNMDFIQLKHAEMKCINLECKTNMVSQNIRWSGYYVTRFIFI